MNALRVIVGGLVAVASLAVFVLVAVVDSNSTTLSVVLSVLLAGFGLVTADSIADTRVMDRFLGDEEEDPLPVEDTDEWNGRS